MKDIKKLIRHTLSPFYSASDVRAIERAVCLEALKVSVADYYCDKDTKLSAEKQALLHEILQRLVSKEPLQYVLGEASFYGCQFKVTPSVLIPRPETAELVDKVVHVLEENFLSAPVVLDIGTGSGCIAISIAKQMPCAEVYAWDLSVDALLVAKENAVRLDAKVSFSQQDMLQPDEAVLAELDHQVDVLVSNPPYVRELERNTMASQVLDHEPHMALFVPDQDALWCYKALARIGNRVLKPNAWIMVEINQYLSKETKNVFVDAGYEQVESFKDIYGNDRIVIAQKSMF